MNNYEQTIKKAIYERRSIRSYIDDKPVEQEKIIKLLESAMAAPSACNIQPWEFIVVTDKNTQKEIRNSIEKYGNYNAPLMIIVCGYTKFIPWKGEGWKMECGAAIENMMLTALTLELGSVWIGGFDDDALCSILDIPDDVYPMGIVYFGYHNEANPARTQYRKGAVHWEKYDRDREHKPVPGNIFGMK